VIRLPVGLSLGGHCLGLLHEPRLGALAAFFVATQLPGPALLSGSRRQPGPDLIMTFPTLLTKFLRLRI